MAATYVYGVTRAGAAPRGEGIGTADVIAIEHGGLAALASELPSAHVRATRRDLMRHAEVLREAFMGDVVLPLRFGTVFETPTQVTSELLEPRHDELDKLLRSFAGLSELTVRATYREEAVLAEIVQENRRIAELRARPVRSRKDDVALGEAVAKALGAKRDADAAAVVDRLRPLSRDVAVEEPRTEYEVVRAAFLVERKRIDRFDKTMDELARAEAARIEFKYVGPLPPHSFVELRRS